MALALCAQLAHLSVLKLSSELHRGGTGRARPFIKKKEKPTYRFTIGYTPT